MNHEDNQEVKKCEQCEEYLTGWKRALADYDNLKKESILDRQTARERTRQDFALRLIPVLDHFDQAIKFQPTESSADVGNWLKGILHVQTQLEETLHEFGLESFGTKGDVFDSHMHESLDEQSNPEMPDHAIVDVIARGWRMGNQIVRPAKVIVNSTLNNIFSK